MRMWMVNPKLMCRKHLLGEHVELHMFVGAINRGKSIEGYIKGGLVDTKKINQRHKELVREMQKRGYKHNSPLPWFKNEQRGRVDIEENIKELSNRCVECRERVCGLTGVL